MTNSWANSAAVAPFAFGADLHLELAGPGLRAGLTQALREAVRTGRLVPGTRLPSSRSLAADLGIARNTVADAYSELVAEGWLTAQQGSGTRVAWSAGPHRAKAAAARSQPTRRRPMYGLLPGSLTCPLQSPRPRSTAVGIGASRAHP
jgi:GntR family transcriptional regulator/MocR family aminotransferase